MVTKFILETLHADGFIKASYQSFVAHQNELRMLRWSIWLDLKEHPLSPVDQPALTVGLLFVSGVIGLLLPHECSLARLPLRLRTSFAVFLIACVDTAKSTYKQCKLVIGRQ